MAVMNTFRTTCYFLQFLPLILLLLVIPNRKSNFVNAAGHGERNEHETGTSSSTGSYQQLRILLMLSRQPMNISHGNFAASIVRVMLQLKHHVRFIMCIMREEDKFDEKTTSELNIEYYKMGKYKKPSNRANVSPFEISQAVDKEFVENSKKMWIEMLQDKPFMDSLHMERFDVGIGEFQTPHKHAFLIYHALNLPTLINIKNFSPDAFQLKNLGVADEMIAKGIPTVNFTEFGDHKKVGHNSEEYREHIRKEFEEYCQSKKMKTERSEISIKKLPSNLFLGFQDQNKPSAQGANQAMAATFPGYVEIFHRIRFYLVNGQPELEFDRGEALKKAKKVRFIGGIHMKPAKEVKPLEKFQPIMDKLKAMESRNGVPPKGIVLIAFGSALGSQEKLDHGPFSVIRQTIENLPGLLFLWKLSPGDERIDELNRERHLFNVYASDWFDQQAILADHRIKAFVSHMGRNSQMEAAFYGVPTVGVPMHYDQFYNAESAAYNNEGLVLDIKCQDPHKKEKNPNGVPVDYCFTVAAFQKAIELSIKFVCFLPSSLPSGHTIELSTYPFSREWPIEAKRLLDTKEAIQQRSAASEVAKALDEILKEKKEIQ